MYRIQDHAQDSGEYLLVMPNLRSLTLHNTRVEYASEDEFRTCFSAFRETLTYLSLETFATSFSAFVTVVDYFPNITTLQLCSFELEPDKRPVPRLSRPFRGKVHVYAQDNFSEFLDRFAKLNLDYEKLVINTPFSVFPETKFVENALQISTGTIKFLKLTAELRCE